LPLPTLIVNQNGKGRRAGNRPDAGRRESDAVAAEDHHPASRNHADFKPRDLSGLGRFLGRDDTGQNGKDPGE
jgi:hypothetical protein